MSLNNFHADISGLHKFWKHMFEVERDNAVDHVKYLCLFSGHRNLPETKDLQDVSEKFFEWPAQQKDAIEWVRKLSDEGREVYFCAHLLNEPKRNKASAARISTLYADGDGAEVSAWFPQPTAVVESSPGRKQFFWRLDVSLPPDEAEDLNKRLTYAIGADKTGWDLTQLMRVPGTVNHKYPNHPPVKIVDMTDEVCALSKFEDALPGLDMLETPIAGNKSYTTNDPESVEPPVRLNDHALTIWNGENAKRKDDGEVDRSASLLRMGRVLYDAGATRRTIVEALRERDQSLGWEKYTHRSDSELQYNKIVDKLEQDISSSTNHDLTANTLAEVGSKTNGATSKIDLLGQRVKLGQIIKEGIEPPEELIEDILLLGKVHQMYAEAGAGKSWLALWLANQLINREERVLYMDAENGPRLFSGRLENMCADETSLDEFLNYHFVSSLPVTYEGSKRYVEELENFRPKLVIFDSWVNFLAGGNLDENVSSDIAKWSQLFARPARERDMSVVILDHVPKEGKSSRGSGRKKEEVDVQWELKGARFDRHSAGSLELIRKKDREGHLPYKVNFSIGGTEDGFVFERSETGWIPQVEESLKDRERKALDILIEDFGSEGATYTEWMEACMSKDAGRGMSKSSYNRAREDLTEESHINYRESKYYPQEKNPSAALSDDEDW